MASQFILKTVLKEEHRLILNYMIFLCVVILDYQFSHHNTIPKGKTSLS